MTIKDVTVRFLGPDFAVVHATWSMVGMKTPPGMPTTQEGLESFTLQRRAGRWLIAAFQNTNAVPETPFPKGPPAPALGASPKS